MFQLLLVPDITQSAKYNSTFLTDQYLPFYPGFTIPLLNIPLCKLTGCWECWLFPSYMSCLLCIWLLKKVMNWNVMSQRSHLNMREITYPRFCKYVSQVVLKGMLSWFPVCMCCIWLLNMVINWNVLPQRSHVNVEWKGSYLIFSKYVF